MVCPKCSKHQIRLVANSKTETIATCVGCLASFTVHLLYIPNTQMKKPTDEEIINKCREKCLPVFKHQQKDKPKQISLL